MVDAMGGGDSSIRVSRPGIRMVGLGAQRAPGTRTASRGRWAAFRNNELRGLAHPLPDGQMDTNPLFSIDDRLYGRSVRAKREPVSAITDMGTTMIDSPLRAEHQSLTAQMCAGVHRLCRLSAYHLSPLACGKFRARAILVVIGLTVLYKEY